MAFGRRLRVPGLTAGSLSIRMPRAGQSQGWSTVKRATLCSNDHIRRRCHAESIVRRMGRTARCPIRSNQHTNSSLTPIASADHVGRARAGNVRLAGDTRMLYNRRQNRRPYAPTRPLHDSDSADDRRDRAAAHCPDPPPPPKLFASAADVTAMIAKAKAERKPDQPNFIQPIVGLAPSAANLEHRVAGIPAPASVHEREAEMFYVVHQSGTLVTRRQTQGREADQRREPHRVGRRQAARRARSPGATG